MNLGRAPKQVDRRTIRYRDVRTGEFVVPSGWTWAGSHPSATIPTPMFGNDAEGCCVVACSGHFALRAEYEETKRVLAVRDDEIHAQYRQETGGGDDGLVLLDHLRLWRNVGLLLGGMRHKIAAFVDVTPQDEIEMREAAMSFGGLPIGVNLPKSALDQLNAGAPWDLTSGPRSAAGSWGGHCVLLVGFSATDVTLVTWGAYQRATWDWIRAYCDEAYAALDAIDAPGIDGDALAHALAHL